MSIVSAQVGIDVAKDTLAISIDGGKAFTIKNSESDLLELSEKLSDGSVVHLESSGGFERVVRRVLVARGFRVRVLNPLNCRRLAQARGIRAKTDPVDARALSNLGSFLPAGETKSIERQRLCDISRAIGQLQKSISQYKLRAKLPDLHEAVRILYTNLAKDLKKEIRKLEILFEKEIQGTSYARAYELAQSVPGVGKGTARVLICELPEDYKSRRLPQIASYAGLAPIDDESGTRHGQAHIGRGNHRIKAVLFMPSLSALRRQPWAKDLYARLRAKGMSHQAAMVAVMRRLLLRAVEIMQRGKGWEKVKPRT